MIVASQRQRDLALKGPGFDPLQRLPDMDYVILERIGRYQCLIIFLYEKSFSIYLQINYLMQIDYVNFMLL